MDYAWAKYAFDDHGMKGNYAWMIWKTLLNRMEDMSFGYVGRRES